MDHSMRVRSAVEVTEGALSDRDGCLRRAMCVMGTIPEVWAQQMQSNTL